MELKYISRVRESTQHVPRNKQSHNRTEEEETWGPDRDFTGVTLPRRSIINHWGT